MEFRKKPVVIEAFQFTRRNNVSPGQPDWFHDAVTRNDVILRNTGKWNNPTEPSYCEINTLEGVMRADEGDWIIRGIKGEIYPCKPDIFTATYEAATPPSPSTAPTVEVDERAAFEAWYAPRHDAVDFTRRPDDDQYDDWDIALQWNAWQARAALASKPPAREAGERQSIGDDEHFQGLLVDLMCEARLVKSSANTTKTAKAVEALIAHIDTWGGAAKGESDGR